jgi:hypothetical protein
MTPVIVVGLMVLTALLSYLKPKYAVLVPLAYLCYWVVTTRVPEYLGYAVPMEQVDFDQARVVHVQITDPIYVLVYIRGETRPRLLSMENTPENKAEASNILKKLKSGLVIIQKGSGKGKAGTSDIDNGEGGGDLSVVPFSEQKIIEKE